MEEQAEKLKSQQTLTNGLSLLEGKIELIRIVENQADGILNKLLNYDSAEKSKVEDQVSPVKSLVEILHEKCDDIESILDRLNNKLINIDDLI